MIGEELLTRILYANLEIRAVFPMYEHNMVWSCATTLSICQYRQDCWLETRPKFHVLVSLDGRSIQVQESMCLNSFRSNCVEV